LAKTPAAAPQFFQAKLLEFVSISHAFGKISVHPVDCLRSQPMQVAQSPGKRDHTPCVAILYERERERYPENIGTSSL
jgi:hypothetical protein